ncbi:unnamed protein product [Urochloa humidicola]
MGADIHCIPDEILELIFLRLFSPINLIRAASACKRWHAVVAAPQFLRRFGSLDGGRHLAAGSFYNGGVRLSSSDRARPSFVASPLVDGGRFSLDFLWRPNGVINPSFWRIVDSRGGLLLWAPIMEDRTECTWYVDMVVCDPLAQRYRVIPPMVRTDRYFMHSGPFLLDSGDGSTIELSSFRVMCVVYDHRRRYRGSMFTSRGHDCGSWRRYYVDGQRMKHLMGHTRASLYWLAEGRRTVTALDRSTAEVSCLKLPDTARDSDDSRSTFKVAAGWDGEARVLALAAGFVMRVFVARGAVEWVLERTIEMSAVAHGLPGYRASYFSGEPRWMRVVVVDTAAVVLWLLQEWWACRLDIETAEAELEPVDAKLDVAFPCELPWPPVLRNLAH